MIQEILPRLAGTVSRRSDWYELSGYPAEVVSGTGPSCSIPPVVVPPLPGVGRRSRPDCVVKVRGGFRIARQSATKVVVIGGSWLGIRNKGDYFHIENDEQHQLDLNDQTQYRRIFSELAQELKQLRNMGKEIVILLQPLGNRLADPGFSKDYRIDPSNDEVAVNDIQSSAR